MKIVSEVDWNNSKYIRAGINPVCYQGGYKMYGFSIDGSSGDLIDFGGHKEEIDEDLLDTAIREYQEESFDLFGMLSEEVSREMIRERLQNCEVFEGLETIQILLPVLPPFYQYTLKFSRLIGNNHEYEGQNLVWLTSRQVLTAIDSQDNSFLDTKIYRMYFRIRDAFQLNRDLI